MNYRELLVALELENWLDIDSAAKTGSCTIRFNDSLEITLEAMPNKTIDDQCTSVQLYAALGVVIAPLREAALTMLMQAHLFGIATGDSYFGLAPDTRQPLFFKTMSLTAMTYQNAIANFAAFIKQAVHWRKTILALPLQHNNRVTTAIV